MAAGDLFLLRTQQDYLGVDCENVFHVLQLAGIGGAASLNVAWVAGPMTNINAVQNAAADNRFVVSVNLDDPTDFDTDTVVGNGVRAGIAMPPFNAWGFIKRSSNRLIRSGGFRVVGISEDDQTNGVRDAPIIPAMDALENAIESVFANGGDTFQVMMHTPGNVATGGAPLTVALLAVQYLRLTSQSSRKFA